MLCYTLKSSILDINSSWKSFLWLLSTIQLLLSLSINLHKIKLPFSSNTVYFKVSFADKMYQHHNLQQFPVGFLLQHVTSYTLHYFCHRASKQEQSLLFLYFHLAANSKLAESLRADEAKPTKQTHLRQKNKTLI